MIITIKHKMLWLLGDYILIEMLRFTEKSWWYYVESSQMIADLGTRRGVTLNQVDQDSVWINGLMWMRGLKIDFPITPVSDLSMSNKDKPSYQKELITPYHRESEFEWPQSHVCEPGSMVFLANRFNHNKIKERHEFS